MEGNKTKFKIGFQQQLNFPNSHSILNALKLSSDKSKRDFHSLKVDISKKISQCLPLLISFVFPTSCIYLTSLFPLTHPLDFSSLQIEMA